MTTEPRIAPDARLALVELLDRDGGVAHRIAVTRWPITIGRALDCDVLLDDPHAAAHHASLDVRDGQATLTVGDTVNGLRLAGRLLPAGISLPVASGSEWQIGRTRLRLRLPGEALAPEQALAPPAPLRGRWLAAGLLLLLAGLLGEHWLESDPGDPLSGYLPVLVAVPIGLGVWCFLWALGAKLFTRHFDFLAHLRLALSVLLASLLLGAALPLAAFALSWPWLLRAGEVLMLALGCILIYGHLSLILPTRRHALAVGFATMFLVGISLKLLLNHQRSDRWFSPLYLSTLGPPALRVAPAVSAERFLDEARRLQAPLERQARDKDSPAWLPEDDIEE
ncbi:MAG: FHA domain-containing protein [Methylibium sp.]|uniref:FHA domain-containing protein n=1 Tax=Methylibium sp. TaxID=2067992 RepID=UPI0017E69D1B|nr:FHA domain-containing protein [Methylibium sp.]MBA3597903.1 FHA domain-containing protein [Methylibium sp.]